MILPRTLFRAALVVMLTAVAAVAAMTLPRPSSLEALSAPRPGAVAPRSASASIQVELLRGRAEATAPEVSITTIFRDHTFSLLASDLPDGAAEEALHRHIRDVFSLAELTSLGTSLLPMKGGSALLEAEGDRIELRITGEAIDERMFRLVVSERREGQEEVATSVIAKRGRTVVLAGPRSVGEAGGAGYNFVCLTPL